MDDNDRRRHAVLLCQHDRRHGFPSQPLRWLRWLQEQLLRSRSHVLRSGPDLLRSRAELLRSGGELLPVELLQIQVPQVEVPQNEVLQVELLCSRAELLRSGPELLRSRTDLCCPDVRRSGCDRLQLA